MTAIYGNDQTFFNAFNVKNPVAFFGFSSLFSLVNYVENIPLEQQNRTIAFSKNYVDFTKTRNMIEAIDLAKNGWSEGIEQAKEISELISMETATTQKYINSISGGFVNVGKMLSGDPVHMRKKAKIKGRKNITIFISVGVSSNIKTKYMIIFSCLVAAMIDMTENAGYSCQLVAVDSALQNEKCYQQTAIKLKDFGEKLNINDIVFALGHPSFLRRFLFAVVGTSPECLKIYQTMGRPCDIGFNEKDIHFCHLTEKIQEKIEAQPDYKSQILKMFELIAFSHSKLLGSRFSI